MAEASISGFLPGSLMLNPKEGSVKGSLSAGEKARKCTCYTLAKGSAGPASGCTVGGPCTFLARRCISQSTTTYRTLHAEELL